MSNFIANVLKLVSGSVTSQILSILLVPIITRIYSPHDFGIFQIFLAVSGILVIFSTFSYQFAIMLPKKEEDSANVAFLSFLLLTLVSLLTAIIVPFIPQDIEYILNAPGISKYLVYLAPVTFLNGLFFVQNYWLSRRVRYGVIAGSRVSNTLSTKIFQLLIPIWSVSPFGLIAGYVGGYGIADLIMLKGVKKDIDVFKKISIKKMKEMAVRYKSFPLFSSWSTLANTISPQVPTFLLSYFYGTSVVGYFGLANQVVNMPMGIVGAAIGQVFFQQISKVKNGTEKGDLKVIVGEVYKKLISTGIFPMLLLLILGEEIFTFAFGKSWAVSGTYVRILIPWIFLVYLSSPISTLYSVFEKQGVWLTFSIILLISRVAALVIGGTYGGSPEFTLGLFSFTGVIFWLWNNAYLLNLAGINKMDSVKILIRFTAIGLAVCTPLIVLDMLSVNFYIILLAVGILTPVYYGIVLREDPAFQKIVSTFLVKVRHRA
jgi:O-antigen/teichoic acid export membrane protein